MKTNYDDENYLPSSQTGSVATLAVIWFLFCAAILSFVVFHVFG